MLICALTLGAQNISVSSFRLLETDLTANTTGTIEKDQNGEVSALIKVVTTQTGFTFDGGSLGIVKAVQKPAEIWVYVPRGFKKITISHPKLGILRDYYIPMAIGSARTYEMILAIRPVKTSATSQTTMPIFGEVEFNSIPSMADIYIDGKKFGQTPQLISDLLVGQHEVRISKQGFGDYTSTVNVKDGETTILSANLEKSLEVYTVGDISFTMVRVDGGTFQMGERGEQGTKDDVHKVTLSPYYIGETEVTQALWKAVMGNNPSYNKGDNRPVDYVSWDMCQEFIQKLNLITGRKFRLPTEAEWEFAARGGNKSHGYKYSGSNNLEDVAWFLENSGNLHDVKTKLANELGLYDMTGNVQELVQDWAGDYPSSEQTNPTGPPSGSHRVCRGNSRVDPEEWCGVWVRLKVPANERLHETGLRLAL